MANKYGSAAPVWVRTKAAKLADAKGVTAAARDLGVSVGALTRLLAGLQQAPGTVALLAEKLR